MRTHEVKQHSEHGWKKRSTEHIHNVTYTDTHYLMACPCNFYGWVPKTELDKLSV